MTPMSQDPAEQQHQPATSAKADKDTTARSHGIVSDVGNPIGEPIIDTLDQEPVISAKASHQVQPNQEPSAESGMLTRTVPAIVPLSTPRPQPPKAGTANPVTASKILPVKNDTSSTQVGGEQTVIPIQELTSWRATLEKQWREEWYTRQLEQEEKRVKNIMFVVDANLSAAQHYIMSIPYRRMPAVQNYDGSTFDPNPIGSCDPAEVSDIITAIKDDTGGHLSQLLGGKLPAYSIPAKLVSKAMSRADGDSYADKIRKEYDDQYKADPTMRSMLTEVGKVLDCNLGRPPPPYRQAVAEQPIVKTEHPSQNSTPPAAAAPKPRRGAAKQKSTTEKLEKAMKYRTNKKNNVSVMLEATPLDIARTHRTEMGRRHWGTKGLIWPVGCFTAEDVTPEEWANMSTNLAKFCPRKHASGWLVLVSGDITTCHECIHRDLELVDIYLPMKTRINILARGYGINSEGQLFNTIGADPQLPQPNHIIGMNNMSPGMWAVGTEKTFRRAVLPVPKDILDAVPRGKIEDVYKIYVKQGGPTDMFLKEGLRPKFNKRNLESRIKNDLSRFTPGHFSLSGGGQEDFIITRWKHFWDVSHYSDRDLKTAATKMIARVEELYESKHLSHTDFDHTRHWFIRQDIVDILSSGTLEGLLIDVTGQTDPDNVPGRARVKFEDEDTVGKDFTRSDINTSKKRKSMGELDTEEADSPRKRTQRKKKAVKENDTSDLYTGGGDVVDELLDEDVLFKQDQPAPVKKEDDWMLVEEDV